jgi:predicted nucleic acid-binding protein
VLIRGPCVNFWRASTTASSNGCTLAGADAKLIATVMKKYEGTRPQLADAALVYLADRDGIDTIFTLDQRDFSVYHPAKKRPFRIVPEP